jgi:hypothetical protein
VKLKRKKTKFPAIKKPNPVIHLMDTLRESLMKKTGGIGREKIAPKASRAPRTRRRHQQTS